MDNFYEQLITSKEDKNYKKAVNLMYVAFGLAFIVTFLLGQIFLGIVFLIIGIILFFLKKNFHVEYEYAFTNGEIDIDRIFEMKSRKRAISFNIREIELMAEENSEEIKAFTNKPAKILNLCEKDYEGTLYVVMLTRGSEKVQIKFTPDEKFLDLCFKYNPRAVKKKTY